MPAESMGFGVTEVDPASQQSGHRDLGGGSSCQLREGLRDLGGGSGEPARRASGPRKWVRRASFRGKIHMTAMRHGMEYLFGSAQHSFTDHGCTALLATLSSCLVMLSCHRVRVPLITACMLQDAGQNCVPLTNV